MFVKRHLALWVQVAGLCATGWMVWTAAVRPRMARRPFAAIFGEALLQTLAACVAGAAITLALYLLIARSTRRDALVAALRVSSTAVWFAPATLLLSSLSPLFLGAALVLVISATRLLYSEWRAIHPASLLEFTATEHCLFELPPTPFRLRDLAPSLLAALGFEAGIVAVLMADALLGAFLFCLATAMLTFAALAAGAYQPQSPRGLPRSILGLALTLILAAGLTAGGMAGRTQHGSRWPWPAGHRPGPMQAARALIERLLHGDESPRPQGTVTTVYTLSGGKMVEINDKSFPGVVLFSEPKPSAKLVAPRPNWPHIALTSVEEEPFVIPFSGEYWMFRPPDTQPPRKSYMRWGSPLTLSFLTTDHAAMAMEAHQKLPHAIDLTCCREIEVAISNADRYPGTVELELILVDDASSQSLGSMPIPTRPDALLRFPIPLTSAFHKFSELKLVFHRDRVRIDRSARIAIKSIILAPHS